MGRAQRSSSRPWQRKRGTQSARRPAEPRGRRGLKQDGAGTHRRSRRAPHAAPSTSADAMQIRVADVARHANLVSLDGQHYSATRRVRTARVPWPQRATNERRRRGRDGACRANTISASATSPHAPPGARAFDPVLARCPRWTGQRGRCGSLAATPSRQRHATTFLILGRHHGSATAVRGASPCDMISAGDIVACRPHRQSGSAQPVAGGGPGGFGGAPGLGRRHLGRPSAFECAGRRHPIRMRRSCPPICGAGPLGWPAFRCWRCGGPPWVAVAR